MTEESLSSTLRTPCCIYRRGTGASPVPNDQWPSHRLSPGPQCARSKGQDAVRARPAPPRTVTRRASGNVPRLLAGTGGVRSHSDPAGVGDTSDGGSITSLWPGRRAGPLVRPKIGWLPSMLRPRQNSSLGACSTGHFLGIEPCGGGEQDLLRGFAGEGGRCFLDAARSSGDFAMTSCQGNRGTPPKMLLYGSCRFMSHSSAEERPRRGAFAGP